MDRNSKYKVLSEKVEQLLRDGIIFVNHSLLTDEYNPQAVKYNPKAILSIKDDFKVALKEINLDKIQKLIDSYNDKMNDKKFCGSCSKGQELSRDKIQLMRAKKEYELVKREFEKVVNENKPKRTK